MNYAEFVAKALNGRSVYAAAKEWGLNQVTAGRYVKGERIPDYSTAKVMANDAGLNLADVFELLASEEENRKKSTDILSKSFNSLLRVANIFAYKKAQMA